MGAKTHASQTLADKPTGPLSGVRILDLTSVVNGAYGVQILADQGADVIKVEDPGSGRGEGGDIMRWAGHLPEGAPKGMGPIFLTINRNKRSIVLDMKQESAKRALRRLIKSCDVIASSIRYDGMKRLGLSYEDVAAIKPDIIFVHAAGYGSDGPYAGEPAYDDLIQSASGMADILPRTDGNPVPRILPTLVADKVSGLFFSQAVTAALLHKARTGEGQFVEVPMFECVTSFLLVEHLYDHTFAPPTGQWGYQRVINPNRKPFATKDGYIGLLPYTDRQWDQFFDAAGYGEQVKNDPRFADYSTRAKHTKELYGLIEQAAATKTTQEWLDILKPLSIPVVKTNGLADLDEDPHLKAVGFFETYEHPEVGTYRLMKPPVKFSKSPANIRRHPPKLGEHTDEILAEFGAHED
ncbi:CaiB/BaiF CoA transferase family protein [Phenylobacterium kunshanense]|uniref:CoA transferase n=1 Tax=Phenylobacterium kunshanense TaxID=1445034 RepID=A0A328BMN5_9CAUL|nr:CoA transferase [Phenylobacterium kunshanense]RAK67256.1 CoA transferase [Phenylobacterium kunshanense]